MAIAKPLLGFITNLISKILLNYCLLQIWGVSGRGETVRVVLLVGEGRVVVLVGEGRGGTGTGHLQTMQELNRE